MTTKRKFNKAARSTLVLFVAMKDALRDRWSIIPYHREAEAEGVLAIIDTVINSVIDDEDVDDHTAAAWLACISLFVASLSWPEPSNTWEEA